MAINLEITMMSAEERSDKKCVYCGSKAKYKHVVTSRPNNTYKAEFYVCNICPSSKNHGRVRLRIIFYNEKIMEVKKWEEAVLTDI